MRGSWQRFLSLQPRVEGGRVQQAAALRGVSLAGFVCVGRGTGRGGSRDSDTLPVWEV